MNICNNKKAFTLIELLVVIAIIGVLSTMAIIALGNARTKARDAKRVADLKQISTALELYYSDYNSYPTIITPGQSLRSPDGNTTYMAAIPSNPAPRNDGNCGNIDYSYQSSLTGTNYSLGSCLGSGSGNMSAGAFFSANNSGPLACGQATVIDIDGYTYNTVQIGTQCWMQQNMRSKRYPNGNCINPGCPDASSSDNGLGRACYNNAESICTSDGALYTLTSAMNSSVTEGAQGICPNGWHVPTDSEQNTLDQYLTDVGQTCNSSRNGAWECSAAGTKLKLSGSSGFNAVIAGYRNPDGTTFANRNGQTIFWSSSGYVYRGISSGATVARGTISGFNLSLRCIKN
ncbi:MAG: prepilin-type N-terminal cleavage/methylation domain-containing protein [Candidatus Falkowbacteria bacterium]|nr:prepilin-type N-terminal cleavage/methylation domain-containing protein [Candidatus Falkowbacteria bacterium]